MASIIKVDQIQTAAGGTPTAADLGITVPSSSLPTGSVLQVVQGTPVTYGNSVGMNNSVYASVMSVSITPKTSTSKFLLMFSGLIDSLGDSYFDARYAKTVDGTTTTIFDNWAVDAQNFGSSNQHGGGYAMNYLDSPATSSAITYHLEGRDNGGATNVRFANSGACTFIVMEIAG